MPPPAEPGLRAQPLTLCRFLLACCRHAPSSGWTWLAPTVSLNRTRRESLLMRLLEMPLPEMPLTASPECLSMWERVASLLLPPTVQDSLGPNPLAVRRCCWLTRSTVCPLAEQSR
jgi:hypothetical protein